MQRRYDVLLYAPALGPLLATNDVGATGGAETQVFLVARALAADGLRVCVCTFDVPGGEIPPRIDGVDIVTRRPYVRGGVVAQVREALALICDLAATRSSVYVTRVAGFHVGLVALAARLTRGRFVYSAANVDDFRFRDYSPPFRDWALHKLGLALADVLIVQTEEQRARCRTHLGRSAVVIPSFVEEADESRCPPDTFLWIGRAAWYKDPLKFVALARAVPEAKFAAVCAPGTGAAEDLTSELERAAALVPNLTLLPPRPRPELLRLLGRAVAVVNTSVSEGMPNATLEGWARGVPALTFAHDPDGLIVQHNLGVFAGASWERFVEGARQLWEKRDRQAELRRRCRAYVRDVHDPRRVSAMWLAAIFGGAEALALAVPEAA